MSHFSDPLFPEPRQLNTYHGRAQRDEYCEECGYPFNSGDDIIIDADSERIFCSVKCAEANSRR